MRNVFSAAKPGLCRYLVNATRWVESKSKTGLSGFVLSVFLSVATLNSAAAGNFCEELCDPHWWATADSAQIAETLGKSDVNAYDKEFDMNTALFTVVQYGTLEQMGLVLDAGAIVDQRYGADYEYTPLMIAAEFGEPGKVDRFVP